VDVTTSTGSNAFHGQLYTMRGTNFLNAAPFFYKQDVDLGTLNAPDVNPELHKWVAGGTLGGPIKRNKLFFFLGYQQLYTSDQYGALSQFQVPSGLSSDRSVTGITTACTSYVTATVAGGGKSTTCPASSTWNASAIDLLQATLPNGQFLIPSADSNAVSQLVNKQPDVTLIGTSLFKGEQATTSLDYDVNAKDRLAAKYFYQHMPTVSPYATSNMDGFPENEDTGAQVFSLDNSINLGSHINWEQRLGFSRQKVYSSFKPQFSASDMGITMPIGNSLPGLELVDFAQNNSDSMTSKLGP
jgi:hypothetical protein